MPVQQQCDPAAEEKQKKQAAVTSQWMKTVMRPDLHPAPVQKMSGGNDGNEQSGGWMSFVGTALGNLELSGMADRYWQTRDVRQQIDAGVPAGQIQIPDEDQRLRNFAEMRELSRKHQGPGPRPAADAMGDANGLFYTFFGNNGGDFSGMDRDEFHRVGQMPRTEALQHLPQLEADTFQGSQDPATRRFGNSLPAENRATLFDAWATGRSYFPPQFPQGPDKDKG